MRVRFTIQALLSLLVIWLLPLIVWGQGPGAPKLQAPASLTGKYEGTGKAANGDLQLTLDLVDDAGKFSGRITTSRGVFEVVKGQSVNGLLSLEFEAQGSLAKLTARREDDKLVGEFTAEGHTGAVELKLATKDELSGDWDAVADAQGQPFPFTLSLKLDGEKVTGSSSSQLGTSQISSGIWKEGKLTILLESGSDQIALIGSMADGKLTGDYDFAGQAQGKWAAVKKKP